MTVPVPPQKKTDLLAAVIWVGSIVGPTLGFVAAVVLFAVGAVVVVALALLAVAACIAWASSAGKVEYRTRSK